MQKLAFFAYPDNRRLIAEAIEGPVELAQSSPVVLKPWKAMQIIGFKLGHRFHGMNRLYGIPLVTAWVVGVPVVIAAVGDHGGTSTSD